MANDSTPNLLSNPFPLVAMLLLAAGVLVRTLPLESARPGDADRAHPSIADTQDVPARLWQDPFAAVNAARQLSAKEGRDALSKLRKPETLRAQIERFNSRPDAKPTQILGVMASTSAFAEDAEARRRERYAVIQGLSAAGYVPLDPEGLGYLEIDNAQNDKLPARVPFEWFLSEKNDASEAGRPRILLLWLEENVLGRQPAERIAKLMQLICGESAQMCKEGFLQPRLAFIGPGTSSGLAKLTEHIDPSQWNRPGKQETWPTLGNYRFDFYSPFATNPVGNLKMSAGYEACLFPNASVAAATQCPIRIVRSIGGDDHLAKLMNTELGLRGVNGEGWSCNDRVVIVAERDTSYGRELARQFRETLSRAPGCEEPNPNIVWEVGYLRGLDGAVADTGAEKTTTVKRGAGGKIDVESLDAPDALREHAEGRSQFDYVRRLAQQIRDHEQAEVFGSTARDYLRLEGAPKIKAIGVLGNDVYDKLLILQALHTAFPYAIFFTTDLDARLLHADQGEWTRNLLVASNYGFTLRRELQASTPPFRNSYQTSTYLATLLAAQGMRENFDNATLNQKVSQWQKPLIFEMGRTRAIALQQDDVAPLKDQGCKSTAPLNCAAVHAQFVMPAHSVVLALVALAAGTLLLLLSSRELYRKARHYYLWSIATFVLAAIVVALIVGRWLRPVTAGLIEPFAWFEGVSLWPSFLILHVAAIAALAATLYISEAYRRAKASLTRDFFPAGDTGPNGGILAWTKYDQCTVARVRFMRALPITAICFIFFLALILLGKHHLPFRGETAWICAVLSFGVAGFLTLYLLFQVLDIVKNTTRFVAWLATCDTEYPKGVQQNYAQDLGLRDCCGDSPARERVQVLESWVDFQLVVRLTSEIERFIYFPFFVLLIFALAQIRLLDDWQISPAILVVVAILVTYVMYCSYSLRRAAEAARARALKHYSDCLLRSIGGSDSPCGPVELIKELMSRIRETRAGAFRPFFQRPALQSLLIPFGGMGGYSIVEYLFTRV